MRTYTTSEYWGRKFNEVYAYSHWKAYNLIRKHSKEEGDEYEIRGREVG